MADRSEDSLLTPAEVAAMFRVNRKTVTRWARAGKISAIRTPGGHHRFWASEVRRYMAEMEGAASDAGARGEPSGGPSAIP
ncbi:MAG: helix-turn-helix domain-containing protein [Acidimicrobiales bacterium]|nr:helix-turn-helix domain-containing protein [Acidimicrobiales bacterium]